MTPDSQIDFSIPSHPMYLQVVRAMMEKVAEMIGLPEETAGRLVLAVDEASSNVIKHAYGNDHHGRIEFLIELSRRRLDIAITDYGAPCDVRRLKPRNLDDVRPGGLGVYIISHVMDEVEYACGQNGRNCIKMTKHF